MITFDNQYKPHLVGSPSGLSHILSPPPRMRFLYLVSTQLVTSIFTSMSLIVHLFDTLQIFYNVSHLFFHMIWGSFMQGGSILYQLCLIVLIMVHYEIVIQMLIN